MKEKTFRKFTNQELRSLANLCGVEIFHPYWGERKNLLKIVRKYYTPERARKVLATGDPNAGWE